MNMKPPTTPKSPKNKRATKKRSAVAAAPSGSDLKFHRFVVQLIDTPTNAAAIDRLHHVSKEILGMVDGPMGCVKRETVQVSKYSVTRPPTNQQSPPLPIAPNARL